MKGDCVEWFMLNLIIKNEMNVLLEMYFYIHILLLYFLNKKRVLVWIRKLEAEKYGKTYFNLFLEN
jgi:hypothetical protein